MRRKLSHLLLFVLIIFFVFSLNVLAKGPTHPSVNTFSHSAPGEYDVPTSWTQWLNQHTDWATSGPPWYFPYFNRNQPVGDYYNVHHQEPGAEDYNSLVQWFTSHGYRKETAFAHWKVNTAQSYEGETRMIPGWDPANDANGDGTRDYPADFGYIGQFSVGSNWIRHSGKNWTANTWQNDYVKLGWWDDPDTVSFTVSRNSRDTIFVNGTIPSHTYYFYIVDDRSAPDHNAVAMSDSLAHICVYYWTQIAVNITHPEVKKWTGHYCAERMRSWRSSYSGPVAVFHDNIWDMIPTEMMGRALYQNVPLYGGVMLEAMQSNLDFSNNFKDCLKSIKDSLTAYVTGQTFLIGNVGNYSSESFDTLLRRCDGVWYERWTGIDQPLGTFEVHKAAVERHQAMGKYTFLNMCGDGDLIGLGDRDKNFSLASYYITYDDKSYYLFDTSPSYGVKLADTTNWWYGSISADLGTPSAPAYTIASGSILRRDFTKGAVLFKPRPDGGSNYTDSTLVSLGGYYYRLDSEGRKSPSDSLNRVYVKNAEGVILIKTGSQSQTQLYPPQPLSPQNGSTVDTTQPTLIIHNVQDSAGRPVLYYFELDTATQFSSQKKKESTPFELEAGQDSTTRWTVPTPLSSGVYYWRSRAYTNTYPSDTSQPTPVYHFQLSTGIGDSIYALYLPSPVGDEQVVTLRPSLNAQFIHNGFDRNQIRVKFLVGADPSFKPDQTIFSPYINIPDNLTFSWTLDRDLQEGRRYFWRVNVYDLDLLVAASDPSSFFTGTIHVFPNPFKPSQGDNFVTFRNTPLYSKIQITTLSGELVRELTGNTSTDVVWDVKNKEGKDLASGVYYYRVDFQSGSSTGKLAVIR